MCWHRLITMVYECTANSKRPSCCTGNIPTEFGFCTALKGLFLNDNELTGEHFFAQIHLLVYESTAVGFVCENALAGAIPTEIGQLAQLIRLDLENNQLTGAPKNLLYCNFGIRVYR